MAIKIHYKFTLYFTEANPPHDISLEEEPFPAPPPPEKAIVSYIKLQPDVAERQKRGGHHGDSGHSDYEGQTTLKVNTLGFV